MTRLQHPHRSSRASLCLRRSCRQPWESWSFSEWAGLSMHSVTSPLTPMPSLQNLHSLHLRNLKNLTERVSMRKCVSMRLCSTRDLLRRASNRKQQHRPHPRSRRSMDLASVSELPIRYVSGLPTHCQGLSAGRELIVIALTRFLLCDSSGI